MSSEQRIIETFTETVTVPAVRQSYFIDCSFLFQFLLNEGADFIDKMYGQTDDFGRIAFRSSQTSGTNPFCNLLDGVLYRFFDRLLRGLLNRFLRHR